jgi:YhcH/YjgK/YiaL family protein
LISTSLPVIEKQPWLAKPLKKALEFLRDNDLEQLEAKTYEIIGEDMFAQVIDFETADRSDIKPESHIKYIDLQYLVTGEEKLGFLTNNDEYSYDEYIEERDLCFYNRSFDNESFTIASPSSINLFFPNDIHMPGIKVNSKMKLRKIVIKISVEYFNNN